MGTSGYCQRVGNVNYSWKTWLSLDNDTRNHLFEVIVQIIEKRAESITSIKKTVALEIESYIFWTME